MTSSRVKWSVTALLLFSLYQPVFCMLQSYSFDLASTSHDKARNMSIGVTMTPFSTQMARIDAPTLNDITVESSDSGELTLEGQLLNYPNPFTFSDGTTIQYSLSQAATITLQIYDMQGNPVYNQTFEANDNGGAQENEISLGNADFSGTSLNAGIYFYLLLNEGSVLGKGKMAVLP